MPSPPDLPETGSAAIADPRLTLLSRIGIFQLLSPLVLVDVARVMHPQVVGPGEVVITQGAQTDALYIIESGSFLVESGPNPVARLGPGEFFGETAMLTGQPRSTSVRAEEEGRVWILEAAALREILSTQPALTGLLQRTSDLRQADLASREAQLEPTNLADLVGRAGEIRIGRLPGNDIVLDSRLVSAHHAVISRRGEDRYVLRDVSSANGTYVNGAEIREADLKDGDQIQIADVKLVFDRRGLARVHQPKGIRIDARNLQKVVKGGTNLLADLSLTFLPGEFVAIVGGSGAGKSTLMDALSGVRPATGGQVLYNGEDFYAERARYTHLLGYVPQDDIIHADLPMRITLDFAARLRLPGDTPAAERAKAVDDAIEQLGLTEQADLFVKALSGGQRKRASIGVELLTQPRIFFLDEPTSGLDPASDRSMMELLGDLARGGSTVVLTTHATKNVELCDTVVFLAKGGHMAYIGPPREALAHFGVGGFDEIYTLLDTETPAGWGAKFRGTPSYNRLVEGQVQSPETAGAAPVPAPTGQRGLGLRLRQFRTLSARSFALYRRNPSRAIPLFVQPLIFSLLLLALFRTGVFDTDNFNLSAPTQLLFIFTFTVFLFGLLWGIQEIVSEFSIFRRERLVNLGVIPYVLSKTAVLVPVMMFGITLMTGVLILTDRLPEAGFVEVYLPLWFTLFLMGLVGLSLALFSSAVAPSSQAATDMLSIWIMPQVLFSGAIFPVPEMALPGRIIALFVPLRWAFEGVARVLDLPAFYAASDSPIAESLLLQYESSFTRDIMLNWSILAAFVVVPITVAIIVLARRTKV